MVFWSLLKILKDLLRVNRRPPVVAWNPGPVNLETIAKGSVTGFDRRLKYPWNKRVLANAEKLFQRLNKLYGMLPLNLKAAWKVTSAYRPGEYNQRAGGAPNSKHLTCEAADLSNVGNVLGIYLLENRPFLERCELWMEHPEATLETKHVHLQTKPPRSGRRVFWP